MASDDPVNDNDFQSIELVAYLKHAHTGTEIKDPKLLKILELGEKEVVMEIPAKKFAQGHYLMVGILAKNTAVKMKTFVCEGRIQELQNLGAVDRIKLELTQFETTRWEELKRVYSKRQNEIMEFFKNVRGLDE